jgi:orotate phosphoribosyltransferase
MAKIMDYSKKTAEIIVDLNTVLFNITNGFTSPTGALSPVTIDNTKLISYPKFHEKIISYMIKLIKNNINIDEIDVVAGTAVGGVPHAAIIAHKLGKPMVFTKISSTKDSKNTKNNTPLKRNVEGILEPKSRVLLIEDHVITGTNTLASIDAIRDNQSEVLMCVSISNDGLSKSLENFKQNGINFLSLTYLNDILDIAIKKNKISSKQEIMIKRWQKDPMRFDEWMNTKRNKGFSFSYPNPVVINAASFNQGSTLGYNF